MQVAALLFLVWLVIPFGGIVTSLSSSTSLNLEEV